MCPVKWVTRQAVKERVKTHTGVLRAEGVKGQAGEGECECSGVSAGESHGGGVRMDWKRALRRGAATSKECGQSSHLAEAEDRIGRLDRFVGEGTGRQR